jgi:4-amino-4-deoxy-L-arabinose transferase-like glycosyltransferase
VWALTPVLGADAALPFAGPELLSRPGRGTPPNEARLIAYLRANRGGAEFLAATLNANTAAPIILETGEPVMSVGGFGGNDNILTTAQFSQMIADNRVRFFVMGGPGNSQSEITRWVETNCSRVSGSIASVPNPNGAQGLYDCKK